MLLRMLLLWQWQWVSEEQRQSIVQAADISQRQHDRRRLIHHTQRCIPYVHTLITTHMFQHTVLSSVFVQQCKRHTERREIVQISQFVDQLYQ